MRESKYLRMALMFGDNNASTFCKNLEKMVSLVLHDKYGECMTVLQIIEELKGNYGLDFSESEILSAIRGKHQNRIVCIESNKDNSLNTYSITPQEKVRIDAKISNTMIGDVIRQFFAENPDVGSDASEFEKILKKYFYNVFNSNATMISELLDQKKYSEAATEIGFSDDEKIRINRFLEWNNTDKDKCVYQMVSCCFDYCMMTVKRNKNIYQNIFRQKRFYLDTNIVFRMMGLNRENRKKLIDTFILKCKEAGIELRYTNHTKKEIYETINFWVGQIRDLLHDKQPISVDSVRSMTSKHYNLSFYEIYTSWCQDPANKVSDYNSFNDDLKRQATGILNQFTQRNFDDYKTVKEDEFYEKCNSLKSYKALRKGYARDEVVQTDINNYMYIRDQNDQDGATDFYSTHSYLISADHVLGDWARERRPQAVPIVVLPSVWYSLILQYAGRADDDYASFTRFLNFSLISYDEEEDPRKIAILKRVISLDEPNEIKERTLYDIESKLQSDYKDFDSIDDIVETSYSNIRTQSTEEIKAEYEQLLQERMRNFETETQSKYRALLQKKESEQDQEKARHAQMEFVMAEKNKELLGKVDDSHEQGMRDNAKRLAESALPKTMAAYWSIAIALLVAILFIGCVIVIKIANGSLEWLPKIYAQAPFAVDLLIEVVFTSGSVLVFKMLLCSLDKKAVRERLIQKYLK